MVHTRIAPAYSARVLLSFLLLIVAGFAEKRPKRILLAPSSTISSGTLLKDLDKCSGIVLPINGDKADYILETAHTPKQNRNYQFTLFSKNGDAIYHTGTINQGNAVKDVCEFINRQTPAAATAGSFAKVGGHRRPTCPNPPYDKEAGYGSCNSPKTGKFDWSYCVKVPDANGSCKPQK